MPADAVLSACDGRAFASGKDAAAAAAAADDGGRDDDDDVMGGLLVGRWSDATIDGARTDVAAAKRQSRLVRVQSPTLSPRCLDEDAAADDDAKVELEVDGTHGVAFSLYVNGVKPKPGDCLDALARMALLVVVLLLLANGVCEPKPGDGFDALARRALLLLAVAVVVENGGCVAFSLCGDVNPKPLDVLTRVLLLLLATTEVELDGDVKSMRCSPSSSS